ncbi:MAG: hypothetical protein H6926_08695 [Chromatiales bacterium]|nr:hypothetical protein [Gammaproteobacteria bacterium]MCP5353245.1 hypothetical protein [Chromatiales bacterium]
MTPDRFHTLLEALSDADWQAVVDGRRVLIVDDQMLAIGPADAANAVIQAGGQADATALRAESLAEAEDLLGNYYRTHPLTEAGFTSQARRLIDQHGAENFAGPFGPPPPRTLFVDGGELLALDRNDPRHRYGAYCEIDAPMAAEAKTRQVRNWVEKGEAYARYIGMNACRYNC